MQEDTPQSSIKQIKIEKFILRLSFVATLIVLIAEGVVAILTRSNAVLMDCVFDIADIVMLGFFIMLVPLLYKPVTEKRPYGFSQFESFFLIIKYGLLIIITIILVISNIGLMFKGGHIINVGFVAVFEIILGLIALITFLLLKKLNKKVTYPAIVAEICMWRIDAFTAFGVGLAFLFQIFLQETRFEFLSPYMDSMIAVVMAVILIKEPILMFIENIKNIALFAPNKEIVEDIRKKSKEILSKYDYQITFIDVIKTGRKIWVEIYIKYKNDLISIKTMRVAHDDIMVNLAKKYDNVYLEIIPEIEE